MRQFFKGHVEPRLIPGAFLAVSISLSSIPVHAQGAPDLDALLSPRSIARHDVLGAPSRDYQGLAASGWMFYPTLLAGVTFDDNVYQASTHQTSRVGTILSPGLTALLDNGVHKLALFASADLRLYPGAADANVYNGKLGIAHVWEAQRDLIFRTQLEYAHQTDVNNNGTILSGGVLRTRVTPQQYNQFTGSVSVTKDFRPFFVALGTSVQATTYDNIKDSTGASLSQSYRDGQTYTVTGRGGMWFGPALYGFVETAGNVRRYNSSIYDSNGYRVVAGVGTDRIGLLKGEIYAGYQQQDYQSILFGKASGAVAGGRVTWFPTRALTISASVDETIGDSTVLTPLNPFGSSTYTTSTSVKLDYAMSREWTASTRAGWDHVDYLHSLRRDQRYYAGAVLNYTFFWNFGVALDYLWSRTDSNSAGASFTRNVVTLGATYKY